jgi:NO-binding membrane sensor protein with MHYT domain
MHFIANRAIILGDGESAHQISYSPGFTALSFFLPILVLMMAFYFLGSTSEAKPIYIVLGGILTGTAVCGMHYLGDYGIANYTCTYRIANVVGAAIIAVAASLIALSVFFRLRATWTDTWWKKSVCAAILAAAVAGMHWTAAVGTRYHYKGTSFGSRSATRVQTVIVCAVLVSMPLMEKAFLTEIVRLGLRTLSGYCVVGRAEDTSHQNESPASRLSMRLFRPERTNNAHSRWHTPMRENHQPLC